MKFLLHFTGMKSLFLFTGMKYPLFLAGFLFFLALPSCTRYTHECLPVQLKTEHLYSPLGLDTPFPRFTWQLHDHRPGAIQTAYRIVVDTDSSRAVSGKDPLWDSGRIPSSRMHAVYNGPKLNPFTRYYWSIRVWDRYGTETATPGQSRFETGMMDVSNWKGHWITDYVHRESVPDPEIKPAPYFRKEFSSSSPIQKARLYMASAGYHELYLNGNRVGDHRIDPAKTRFDRRILYVTHDVTNMIRQGDNAIGVILGNGWYNHQSVAVWYFHQATWRSRPSFSADLRITYEDGTVETIHTGRDWKTSTGPIIFNSIYTGEHYDARLEQKGWNKTGFDDSSWSESGIVQAPAQNITSQAMHPVRKTKEISPRSMIRLDDRTYVFDLGRNIAGISRLEARGEEGTRISIKHGETLDEDGRVNLSGLEVHYRPEDDSDPFQTDLFILSGQGKEVFEPRFNYKGFQYVEVTADRPIELHRESLTAYFLHSDVPATGYLHSSSELINKIWQAANASYLSNLHGYPTDCPQREKLGWTGDGHIAIETGLFNFDGITLYEKWIADHRDEQQPSGMLPAIIPTSGWGYYWANGIDWTSSMTIIPWTIYRFYGDSRLLETTYDNIRNYVDFFIDRYPEGLTDFGLGDWVPVHSRADRTLTSTVYYYVVVSILADAANLFGKQEDHQVYSSMAEKIKTAFNNKFLNKQTGIYGNGYQTELSMPLYWGLVPAELKPAVAENLARAVEENQYYLDVGLLGSKALLNALSENGYADVAWKVASKETFPSWGWWIRNGATTFFENWRIDADRDLSMNHIMFGEISAWLFKTLGGIQPDADHPGFEHILLRPHFAEGLDHFKASYQSPRGPVLSAWKRTGEYRILYTVSVPPNSRASLYLEEPFTLLEGAVATIEQAKQLKRPEHSQPRSETVIRLPAGFYRFELISASR